MAAGQTLHAALRRIVPIAEKRDLRLDFHYRGRPRRPA
jgi:hypothetical protein